MSKIEIDASRSKVRISAEGNVAMVIAIAGSLLLAAIIYLWLV